jgi:hypothetical protein
VPGFVKADFTVGFGIFKSESSILQSCFNIYRAVSVVGVEENNYQGPSELFFSAESNNKLLISSNQLILRANPETVNI